ncbi:MAG TPA: DUF3152 domain-containing protein [Acidimicrobiales bacterium]|nr:DUF3152 domain-containing protein [Acidimicrobiales bacterium]
MKRQGRRWAVTMGVLCGLLAVISGGLVAPPAGAVVTGPVITYTYSVATTGPVRSDIEQFAAHVASTYADPRGWSLGGSIRFVRVPIGGDFTVWLASADSVPGFSSACSPTLSCRVGRNVIINDDRWSFGALSFWPASLDEFRHFEVNHETGHWLGLPHPCMGGPCVPPGQLAPVMMQQPKGLFGDLPNWWPLPSERQRVAAARGLPILHAPKPGLAATPTGSGYWITESDGRTFAFGGARNLGSIVAVLLNAPLVDIARTPSGQGYWLVAADGGIFTFGDATFHGSTGAIHLNQPIVGMAPTPSGQGYWLVAADGGIFTFGNAPFLGSAGGFNISAPVAAMAVTPSGGGYWLQAADGGIFTFGDAPFYGSAVGISSALSLAGAAANTANATHPVVGSVDNIAG